MSTDKRDTRVLFLAAEAAPFIKVGGLGDVAGSLPLAIHDLVSNEREAWGEVDIRMVIPFHGGIDRKAFPFHPLRSFDIQHRAGPIRAEVFEYSIDGLPVYLIAGKPFPDGAPVYSGNIAADAYKYTFVSLASLELARELAWQPVLIHANDWHTASAIYSVSLKRDTDPFYAQTATLICVHNLPFLGQGAGAVLLGFGLPPASNSPLPWWAQDMPLPQALLTADHIVAVSPSYAREIITPEFGSGLHEFLQTRASDISGIINGIDLNLWNPSDDAQLLAPFSPEDLSTRELNKEALQKELQLEPDPSIPLLGMITRMDNQKGLDLVPDALRQLADQPWQAVILGTGIHELEEMTRTLETDMPDRVRSLLKFDQPLSRRIYAGADALLLPSRYEPCGLAQMIAMRYGCVPIARAVGGLRDTIQDADQFPDGNGFLFTEPSSASLADCITRALTSYRDPEGWRRLQRQGMLQDFSWEHSARQYLERYQILVSTRQEKL
jgi:starch synthase